VTGRERQPANPRRRTFIGAYNGKHVQLRVADDAP